MADCLRDGNTRECYIFIEFFDTGFSTRSGSEFAVKYISKK